MKVSELRQKSSEELKDLTEQKKERLRFLRFGLSSGKVKNVRELKEIRKDIARIMGLLSKKK